MRSGGEHDSGRQKRKRPRHLGLADLEVHRIPVDRVLRRLLEPKGMPGALRCDGQNRSDFTASMNAAKD